MSKHAKYAKKSISQLVMVILLLNTLFTAYAEDKSLIAQAPAVASTTPQDSVPSSVYSATYQPIQRTSPLSAPPAPAMPPIQPVNYGSNVTTSVYAATYSSYLVKFKSLEAKNRFKAEFENRGSLRFQKEFTYLPFALIDLTDEQLQMFKIHPDISYIEKNKKVTLMDLENESVSLSNEATSWGHELLRTDLIHREKVLGQGIKIAVFDTGIDKNHTDLRVAGGISLLDNDDQDTEGHGTKIAGIIGAQLNNYGTKGLAPSAELYAVKMIGNNREGDYSQIMEGLDWAMKNRINIVNMSFSGLEESQSLHDALQLAWQSGILLVSAAGNEGKDVVKYPASDGAVMAVGSMNADQSVAPFSNYGSRMELIAPGVDIKTTNLGNSYIQAWGTSISSAFVSGAAALVWSAHPKWTNEQVRLALLQSAKDTKSNKYAGSGVLDIYAAIHEQYNKTVQINIKAGSGSSNPNGVVTIMSDIKPPATTMNISGTSAGNGIYYGTIQIALTATDDTSGVRKTEYSVDGGGSWSLYTGPIALSTPKTYSFKYRSTDHSGNVEKDKAAKITIKSDNTPPSTTITLSGTKGSSLYYRSPVTVQLIAVDDNVGVKQTEYSLNGGSTWDTYSKPFVINEGKVTTLLFRSTDSNNNVEASKTAKIFIDTVAPTAPAFSYNPQDWTAGMVSVTVVDGKDIGSGVQKSQYRLQANDAWIDYSVPFVVSNSAQIFARTWDVAGNASEVTAGRPRIDHAPPSAPRILISETDWTKDEVFVTVQHGEDLESQIAKTEYKVGENGAWTEYLHSFVITEEGQTVIFARSVDNVGNMGSEASAIVKRDVTAPSIPVIHPSVSTWTNQEVTFNVLDAQDPLSGVDKYQYRVGESGPWADFTSEVSIASEGITTVYAKAYDKAGNVSGEASTSIKIDKTPPLAPQVTPSTTKWTQLDVTFIVTDGSDALSGVYKSQYKRGASGVWTDYTASFAVTTEGETPVYARTIDVAGNIGPEASSVAKIDRTPPSSPAFLIGTGKYRDSVTLKWAAATDNVGVTAYNVYDGDRMVGTTTDTALTVNGLSLNGLHYMTVEAVDEAENRSLKSSSLDFMTSDTEVSAFRTSFVMKNDGSVWGWGRNHYGQLGDGTRDDSATPKLLPALAGVKSIAAGGENSILLKQDGTVWALGNNNNGMLGDQGTAQTLSPRQVPALNSIESVSVGLIHALALKSDGTVWAWGGNEFGEVGDGAKNSRAHPFQIPTLKDVAAVSASYYHSLALKSDGTVWAWGGGGNGQLGTGDLQDRYTPVQVANLDSITAISAGPTYSLALKRDGTVWYWGNDSMGFGYISNEDRGSRVPVMLPNLNSVVDIRAGGHVLVLKKDGSVWALGENRYGQLGDGTDVSTLSPVQVSHLSDVTSISADDFSSLVTKGNGLVWVWGSNLYTEREQGTVSKTNKSTPARVQPVQLTADTVPPSAPHIQASGKTGTTVTLTWNEGVDNYGVTGYEIYMNDELIGSTYVELKPSVKARTFVATGLAPFTTYSFYVKAKDEVGNSSSPSNTISATTDDYVSPKISVGDRHTLALRSDGTVWSWGIGQQTATSTSEVSQVNGLDSIVDVQAGGQHSLALRSDGNVLSWGYNAHGQLGDGSLNDRTSPVQINGLHSIIAISVGKHHSLALQSDGTVWAWGDNQLGQLGDGSFHLSVSPRKVAALSSVTAVSAKAYASAALKSDGTVWVWGSNVNSQLQPTTTKFHLVLPEQLAGLSSIKQISLGGLQSSAIAADGSLYVWGVGFPGDGQSTKLIPPMKVPSLDSVLWTSSSSTNPDVASQRILEKISLLFRKSCLGNCLNEGRQGDCSLDRPSLRLMDCDYWFDRDHVMFINASNLVFDVME